MTERPSTPLLSAQRTNTQPDVAQLVNVVNPTRSTLYLLVLTVTLGGLQLAWSTEFSEGTPYLLSLGVSKQTLLLIWIAGPLSGTLGQPVVGIYSDFCNLKLGRRRPYIIGGCLATAFSLWYLSHTTTLVNYIFYAGHGDLQKIKHTTIPFAAFGVYLLDFSISVIQAASRAFIVDCVPTNQQNAANAWLARMIGIFNIVGFYLGSIDLTKAMPFLGDNQFKILALFAAIFLVFFTLISCFSIKERDPNTDIAIKLERAKKESHLKELGIESHQSNNILIVIKSLVLQTYHSIKRLPPQVAIVCYAEFFAWIGYFPMLFYTTTYVGELFLKEIGKDWKQMPEGPDKQRLIDESTRRGSLALLLHAIVSLIVDLVLPLMIKPMDQALQEETAPYLSQYEIVDEYILKPYHILKTFIMHNVQKLSVRSIWIISHAVFVVCMLSTFLISTSGQLIVMFAFLGFPWGVSLWAPFVLISEEISRIKDIKAQKATDDYMSSYSENSSVVTSATVHPRLAKKYDNYENESGIILGIHNVFVAAPQVISSLMSSFLFWLLRDDDSLGWVFRFGGLMCLGALWLSCRVKSKQELELEDEIEVANA